MIDKKLLGVCVGMQMLAESSDEGNENGQVGLMQMEISLKLKLLSMQLSYRTWDGIMQILYQKAIHYFKN